MSGTLALVPNEHGGTTFEVVLPVKLLDLNRDPAAKEIKAKPIKGWLTDQEDARPTTETETEAVRKPEADDPAAEPSTIQPPEPSLSLHATDKVRVLVVDDNDISRKLLLMALRKGSVKVSTAQATNGQEAIDRFRDFQPDLVFTDVSMPIMDGLTAAGHMRQVESERDTVDARCRIFAITGLGSSDPRLQKDALEGEASLDGWLVKGEHGLEVIYNIVKETREKRESHRTAHRAQGKKQEDKVVAGKDDETAEPEEVNEPEPDRESG
jgi:CheY-like chemotaxis protein